jgi:hypothetical protein
LTSERSGPFDEMDEITVQSDGELCGWASARAHTRAGDPVAIASYLGRGECSERPMATFADRFEDRNEAEYDALREAAEVGVSRCSGVAD